MIKSFKNKDTAAIWEGSPPKGFPPDLIRRSQRALARLNAALVLDDLKTPPGNHLHALVRDRAGQHAISVNDQFRVCFRWQDGNAYEVEITDYH